MVLFLLSVDVVEDAELDILMPGCLELVMLLLELFLLFSLLL